MRSSGPGGCQRKLADFKMQLGVWLGSPGGLPPPGPPGRLGGGLPPGSPLGGEPAARHSRASRGGPGAGAPRRAQPNFKFRAKVSQQEPWSFRRLRWRAPARRRRRRHRSSRRAVVSNLQDCLLAQVLSACEVSASLGRLEPYQRPHCPHAFRRLPFSTTRPPSLRYLGAHKKGETSPLFLPSDALICSFCLQICKFEARPLDSIVRLLDVRVLDPWLADFHGV